MLGWGRKKGDIPPYKKVKVMQKGTTYNK
jgi:hypothetical protein